MGEEWVWKTLDAVEAKFEKILASDKLPYFVLFEEKFKQNLKNQDFKNEMIRVGALLQWNHEENKFTSPWTLNTIREALEAIKTNKSQSGSSQTKNLKPNEPPQMSLRFHVHQPPEATMPPTSATDKPPTPKPRRNLPPLKPQQSEDKLIMDNIFLPRKINFKQTLTPVPSAPPRMDVQLQTTSAAPRLEDCSMASSSTAQDSSVHMNWGSNSDNNISGQFSILTQKKYIKVSSISTPKMDHNNKAQNAYVQILPYIIQKIKMWGVHVLRDNNLNAITNCFNEVTYEAKKMPENSIQFGQLIPKSFSGGVQEEKSQTTTIPAFNCSRVDLLTLLISITDNLVLADIYRVLSQFHLFSLPMIVPDIQKSHADGQSSSSSYQQLIDILQHCKINWTDPNTHLPVQNYLFVDPFILIVALRLGKTEAFGKSTILNCLFQESNVFTSKQHMSDQQSKENIPLTLPGLVELVWLTEETSSPTLWKRLVETHYSQSQKLILLANLHGNALDYPSTLKFLQQLCSRFIVFYNPDVHSNVIQVRHSLQDILPSNSNQNIFGEFLIDPCPAIEKEYPEHNIINTSPILHSAENVQKLTNLLLWTVKMEPSTTINSNSLTNLDTSTIQSIIDPSHKQGMATVNEILQQIQLIGTRTIRGDVFLLQKMAELDTVTALEHLETNKYFGKLMNSFAAILRLPIQARKYAMAQLELKLGKLSLRSQGEVLTRRHELFKEKARVVNHELGSRARISNTEASSRPTSITSNTSNASSALSSSMGSNISVASSGRESNEQIQKVQTQIDQAFAEYHARNLGIEHFVRELGKLYQLSLLFPENQQLNNFRAIHTNYAQLLLEGSSIELLDGDLNEMSHVWIEGLFHSICTQAPGLKIFVISILGLESSGKSTLLNALFGCQFAVSEGRCTRGLFLRLLYLNPSLKLTLGNEVDAVLLIDTEGLGSSVRLNQDFREQDRLMATFAMCISDLTLINIRGNINEMAEILEIVIVTLARLEQADICPDILLVQHLGQKSSAHLVDEGIHELYKSLGLAVEIVQRQEMEYGIQNSKNIQKLGHSILAGEICIPFGNFKAGPTDYSPPSAQYHEDVQKLYSRILDHISKLRDGKELHTWHSNLYSYWKAVQGDNFARQFRNIKEMTTFLEKTTLAGKVKQLIDSAFRRHRKALLNYIDSNIVAIEKFAQHPTYAIQIENLVQSTIVDSLGSVPKNCDAADGQVSCKTCTEATAKMNQLFRKSYQDPASSSNTNAFSTHNTSSYYDNLEQDVSNYIMGLRSTEYKHLMGTFISKKMIQSDGAEFDKYIEQVLAEEPSNSNIPELVEKILVRTESMIKQKYHPEPLIMKIKRDLKEVYPEATASEFSKLFGILDSVPGSSAGNNGKEPQLNKINKEVEQLKVKLVEDVEAFRDGLDGFKRSVTTLFKKKMGSSSRKYLQPKEMAYFYKKFNQLPSDILTTQEHEKYESGMMFQLKEKLKYILMMFERKYGKLLSTFKWNLNIFAIKLFVNHVVKVDNEWNAKNQPLSVLKARREYFTKKLHYRLLPDNSIERQGNYIALHLLNTLKTVVKKYLENVYVQRILDHPQYSWIRSIDTIRLQFLTSLATQVSHGAFKAALEHFASPKNTFIEWYQNSLDNIYSNHFYSKTESYEVYRSSLVKILQIIEESSSVDNLKVQVAKIVGKKGSEELMKLDLSQILNGSDLAHLKQIIESKCWEQQQSMYDAISLNSPAEHAYFLNFLGCTAACSWCGGLCWGHKDHEKGFSIITKHHTCHQPRGLVGTIDINTEELIATSCDYDYEEEDAIMAIGDSSYNNNKSPLIAKPDGEAYKFLDEDDKILDYWIYKQHPKRQFAELMKWFYVQLMPKLAEMYNVKETSEVNLSKAGYGVQNQQPADLNSILALIQVQMK